MTFFGIAFPACGGVVLRPYWIWNSPKAWYHKLKSHTCFLRNSFIKAVEGWSNWHNLITFCGGLNEFIGYWNSNHRRMWFSSIFCSFWLEISIWNIPSTLQGHLKWNQYFKLAYLHRDIGGHQNQYFASFLRKGVSTSCRVGKKCNNNQSPTTAKLARRKTLIPEIKFKCRTSKKCNNNHQ